jgi:hypothetical protein
MSGELREVARALAAESRQRQGLDRHVADPATLSRVAALLRNKTAGRVSTVPPAVEAADAAARGTA